MKKILAVLAIAFLAGFFMAGGSAGALTKIIPTDAAEYQPKASSVARIVFLREAVEEKLPDERVEKKLPESLKQAVIAVEDARFYTHGGFDMAAIFRALVANIGSGGIEEGASTITQQLVKNLFLSEEQTVGRKVEELILAVDMETRYSKDEILNMYLSEIYYGSGYYGIRAAAAGYFGKEPLELTLPEAAMLAGLPNAPSVYSPYEDFILAKKRQFIVLDAMAREGFIDDAAAMNAKLAPIYLAH